MIQINKQLTRLDGGHLASGSIVPFQPQFNADELSVSYYITHWYKPTSKEDGFSPVSGVIEFSYIQFKECTIEEWALLNEAGSADVVEQWLVDILD